MIRSQRAPRLPLLFTRYVTPLRSQWEREFPRWLAPCRAALGDTRRERWAPRVSARSPRTAGERKRVEPLAAPIAPDDYEQVHHFVCTSCWDPGPLEPVLATRAEALIGGPQAVLIIDDTALRLFGPEAWTRDPACRKSDARIARSRRLRPRNSTGCRPPV